MDIPPAEGSGGQPPAPVVDTPPVIPGAESGVSPSTSPLGDISNLESAVKAAKAEDAAAQPEPQTTGTPTETPAPSPQEQFTAQFSDPASPVPPPAESPNPDTVNTGLGDAGSSVAEAPVPTAEATPQPEQTPAEELIGEISEIIDKKYSIEEAKDKVPV